MTDPRDYDVEDITQIYDDPNADTIIVYVDDEQISYVKEDE
jgi:hypothetical protein